MTMADAGEGPGRTLADRIDRMEAKFTHQDEVIEVLNRMVVEQWGKLDRAELRIRRLEERVRELQDGPARDPSDEPPPPHY